MDPDATLDALRKIVKMYEDEGDVDAERLVALFDSLDSWLSRGGFLPLPWLLRVNRK